MFAGTKTK